MELYAEKEHFLFSISVQIGPGAHPASHTLGTAGPVQRLKWSVRGVDHPLSSIAEVKRGGDIPLRPLCSAWHVTW
jgi:hypothetical protein